MEHQTSPLASPRRPQREPGRSACVPCTLRTSANAAQAAPGGISVENCQQLAGDARKLCYAVHEACTNGTPRVLHTCRDHAETFPLTYKSISSCAPQTLRVARAWQECLRGMIPCPGLGPRRSAHGTQTCFLRSSMPGLFEGPILSEFAPHGNLEVASITMLHRAFDRC